MNNFAQQDVYLKTFQKNPTIRYIRGYFLAIYELEMPEESEERQDNMFKMVKIT